MVRLTKIIATLGPASGTKGRIKSLVQSGVDLFRINLSHGKHEQVEQWIRWIREVEHELGRYVGVLLDLQGPKIRVGKFEGGSIHLHKGQKLVMTTEKKTGGDSRIPVQYARFHQEVRKGDMVFMDDGNISVQVRKVSGTRVHVEVRHGGILSDHKGVNLPDTAIQVSALTRKDKEDLKFGLKVGVDFVALSFAGSARDIRQLRRLIKAGGGDADIIAKIERKQAVARLQEIVKEADAVMVARGDLGIEIPIAEVPVVQQRILEECTHQSKPVIVATQMLESMIENARPTRAEVSDIANSVMDCADAIMLSAETAVGKHPKAAVQMMHETALKTEAHQKETQHIPPWSWYFQKEDPSIPLGVSYSANRMVELLNASAILVFTLTGGTARMITAPHPMVPVFAFTASLDRARRLTLLRGAVPFLTKSTDDYLGDVVGLFAMLKKKRLVKKNDRLVIASGVPVGIPQWTNVIRVENVP